MADGDLSRPARTPSGEWVPVPDPTTLTTEAVERATGVFRRELQALRETLETRLDAADADRSRLWELLQGVPQTREVALNHLRDEMVQRDEHSREVITQRLNDLDQAARIASGHIEKIPVDLTDDFRKALRSEREYILSQIENVRDVATERYSAVAGRFSESREAVDRAFAAAKEAVTEQNRSNTEAIKVSEGNTKEQLTALSQVSSANFKAMEDKITDARDRLTAIENLTRGIEKAGGEAREQRTEQRLSQGAILSLIVAAIIATGVVVSIIALAHK